ncbi:protein inscuteable homolog isoform X1 [Mytilus edulis]|uniref:protein inscuteable homolog isoform X1 n=2 Tax=Mytilus edulis TaxID=6550 RepID=UPI0039F06E95
MLRHSKYKQSKSPAPNTMRHSLIIDPVDQWLLDIQGAVEMECMSVLQGKSILKHMDKYAINSAAIRSAINTIRNESHLISGEFSKLYKSVNSEKWKNVYPYTIQVTCHIRSLIHECNETMPNAPTYILEQQEVVMGECAKLAQLVESTAAKSDENPSRIPVVNQLTFLGQAFSRMVDLSLGHLTQKIIITLDEANEPPTLATAMRTIVTLGLEGEHMCYIIAREGGVRALLEICHTESLEFAHCQALRALATISCVAESLFEIEKEGGVETLIEILCDTTVGEKVRGEVAGVIAQITSPCLENYQQMSDLVDKLEDLLRSLLGLASTTESYEIFLLSSAAIANITFMDSLGCEILAQYEAPRILIKACSTPIANSVFAKDQVVTVLANMVAVDVCRPCIINNNGISLCLELLSICPADYKSASEISACERVQQKAAIALTRMCREEEIGKIICTSEGIPRLVQLCRYAKERNNSEAVLVACLAALRKINSQYKSTNISPVDYHQLIQPRLMDSFLICTNTDENFV